MIRLLPRELIHGRSLYIDASFALDPFKDFLVLTSNRFFSMLARRRREKPKRLCPCHFRPSVLLADNIGSVGDDPPPGDGDDARALRVRLAARLQRRRRRPIPAHRHPTRQR